METIETLIPDNEGNHLVVVLYFYENIDKANTFLIPQEFINLDIADININKLDQNKPLKVRAFFKMCHWLSQKSGTFRYQIKNIIVGPAGYQTYARVFFRDKHAPIIHFVTDHICSKFPE